MRLLLDESLPVKLRHYFVGHEVRTVRYMGWLSAGNGDLLALAQDEFDAIITCDKRMRYEQSLTAEDVAIVTLNAVSNGMDGLLPLIRPTLAALPTIERGQSIVINPE